MAAGVPNLKPLRPPLSVLLHDGSTCRATHQGTLPLPVLQEGSQGCLLTPESDRSLLSVARLVDSGHEVRFRASDVLIERDGAVALQGHRDWGTGMWNVDLPSSRTLAARPGHPSLGPELDSKVPLGPAFPSMVPPAALNAAPLPTVAHLVAWLHAALGSPAETTLANALRRGYIVMEGLTPESLSRHPPQSLATAKGHLARHRQGQQSTRDEEKKAPHAKAVTKIPNRDQEAGPIRGRLYLDSTGSLPTVSARGADSILVLTDAASGFIHLEPVAGRKAGSLTKAFRAGVTWFKDNGIDLAFLRLDNEVSNEMRQAAKGYQLELEVCPPGNHRANAAERHIRTVKDHLVSVLAATDESFPPNAWDLLLQQVELSINLLRPCRSDQSISAWQRVCGPWDFRARPIAPMGTPVLVFESREERKSWDPHGKEGWYLGPAKEHYRCYRVLVQETGGVRVTDTLSWHPSRLLLPQETVWDRLSDAIQQLASVMREAHDDSTAHGHPALTPAATSGLARELTHLEAALQDSSFVPARSPPTESPAPDPASPASTSRRKRRSKKPGGRATSPSEGTAAPRPLPASSSDLPASKPDLAASLPPPPPAQPAVVEPPSDSPKQNPCRICLEEDGIGLLCEGCDTCWHAGCLGLSHIPRGDWFCPACRAKAAGIRGEQGVGVKECAACGVMDHGAWSCNSCSKFWHGPCVGLRPPVPPSWKCPRCRPPPRDGRGRLLPPTRELGVAKVSASTPPKRPGTDPQSHALSSQVLLPPPWTDGALADPNESLCALVCGVLPSSVSEAQAMAAQTPRLTYRKALQGHRGDAFREALRNEHRTLFGPGLDGEACLRIVPWDQLPAGQRPCRYVLVAKDKQLPGGGHKAKVRGVCDGSDLTQDGPVSAETADIDVVKAHWHACLARGWLRATADLTAFYVGSPMQKEEWMAVRLDQLPAEVAADASVRSLARGGRLLVRVDKGIYGLPQAGRLARDRLVAHLAKAGYSEAPHVPSLFSHTDGRILFVLTVDDFDIAYERDEDLQKLLAHLRGLYEVTVDLDGRRYIGVDTSHDPRAGTMRLSMDSYYRDALEKLGVTKKGHPPGTPMPYSAPPYGKTGPQLVTHDFSPLASQEEKKYLQRCVGTLLYPARWVDPLILTALSRLAAHQAAPTRRVMEDLDLLLQYVAWRPFPSQTLRRSGMHLMAAADASFAGEPKARSRAGGVIWLGEADGTVSAPLACLTSIIPIVVASAAEAEYATLHTVGSRLLWIRTILEALGFSQAVSPGTPLLTDNDCARGIANRLTKLRRTKALDVRMHWTRDKVDLGLIQVLRCDGVSNPADFLTKGHPAAHVRRVMGTFVDTSTCPVGTVLPIAQTEAQLRASRRCPPEPVPAPFRFEGLGSEVHTAVPPSSEPVPVPFRFQGLGSGVHSSVSSSSEDARVDRPFTATVRYPGRPPETARKGLLSWCSSHPWSGRYPGGRPVVCERSLDCLQLTRRPSREHKA
jgi:hypothetical protein